MAHLDFRHLPIRSRTHTELDLSPGSPDCRVGHLAEPRTPAGWHRTFCHMRNWVVTCIVALVFGSGGAVGAVAAMHDQLQGEQGPDGLTGARGQAGIAGSDGTDGANGVRGRHGLTGRPGRAGKPGQPGKAAPKAPPAATDLGTANCAGSSVEVVTKARINAARKLVIVRKRLCLVNP